MVQNTVQSSYNRYGAVAQAGMPADMSGWDADTRLLESASAGFGLAVSQGTNDHGAILGGNTFCGITIRDITLVHSTPDQYQQGDNMACLVKGDIWVQVATDVVKKKGAYYNSSTGAIGASSISNAVAIASAEFLDSASSGGFARVRLANASGDITT